MKKLLVCLATAALILGVGSLNAQVKKSRSKQKKENTEKVDSVATPTDYSTVDFKTADIRVVGEAAKAEVPEAMLELGLRYATGKKGVEEDIERAAKWWAKAAKAGNAEAASWLGLCFQYGEGTKADSLQAAKLFRTSIDNGYTDFLEVLDKSSKDEAFAAFFLADYYSKLKGGKHADPEKEELYLRRAYDMKSVRGLHSLGLFYINHKMYPQAYEIFQDGAARQDTTSLYYSALMVTDPKYGISGDATEALANMRAAADADFRHAQYTLGNWYDQGVNVTKDPKEAQKYWKRAAANGSDYARWALGLSEVQGREGIPANYAIALNWLTATNPKVYSKTFRNLFTPKDTLIQGTQFGTYVQALKAYEAKDYADAKNLFKQVSKKKGPNMDAMIALCDFYNPAVKYDQKKLNKALEKASKNDPYAKYLLAQQYIAENIEPDKTLALLEEAADAGVNQAYSLLGDIYAEGRLVRQNYTQAAGYYNKAYLTNGLSNHSATLYADILKNGRGVEANPDFAATVKALDPEKTRALFLSAVPTSIE